MMPDIQIDDKLIKFLLFLPVFLISLGFHEFSHAFMAHKYGDDTAKNQNRLTLNPFKHLELVGSIILPFVSYFTGFALLGWAKPVPVNRANFKNEFRDDAIVTAAGPLSNLLLAVFFTCVLIILVNIPALQNKYVIEIASYGVFFNVFLCLFNLLPIPPLDGSYILYDLFPNKYTAKLVSLGLYGSIILLLFIYSPLWKYFFTLVIQVFNFFTKIALI